MAVFRQSIGAMLLFLSMSLGDSSRASDVVTKIIPLVGKTSSNGWTYHGGPMLVEGIAPSRDQKKVWLASSAGLVCLDLDRQQWRRWTTLDGLADNYVLNVDVDRQGNVWAATFSGISRFDGTSFRNWGQEDLGHHRMGSVAVDAGGRIWAGCPANRTPRGAMCLVRSGRWVQYNTWNLDSHFMHAVTDIEPDADGGVWICGNEGKLPMDTGAGYYQAQQPRLFHVDRFGTPEQITLENDFWPRELAVEKTGHLLAVVNPKSTGYFWNAPPGGTLYRLTWERWIEKDGDRIPDFWKTSWKALGKESGLDAPVRTLYRDRNGTVWIATETSIGVLEGGTFTPRIPIPDGKGPFLVRMAILENGKRAVFYISQRGSRTVEGGVRVGTDTGVFVWDGDTWTQLVNPVDGPVRPGRGMPIIGNIRRDLDGRLHFIRHADTVFDGKTWTVRPEGLKFVLNKHGRVVATYQEDSATKRTLMRIKGRSAPVSHKDFFGVDNFPAKFRDSRGHYWAYADDLKEFDGKRIVDHMPGNEFFFRKIPGVGIYNRTIRHIAEDAENRLWAATTSGLLRHAGGTKWEWVGGRFDGMFGMMGWHVASNGKDILSYAGTWGTSEYDMLAGKWLAFTQRGRSFTGVEDRFLGSYVEAVYPGVDGRIWYGTYEGGVAVRDSEGDWQHFTTRDGLACNSCWGIWCDDDGTMWFTSQAGASSLNLKQFQRRTSTQ